MTDNLPAWHDNYLACYPYLIAQLEALKPFVKSVQEAKELEDVTDIKTKKTPLDGAVYVVLDSFTPTTANAKGSEQDIELGFTIMLAKRNYTPDPAGGADDVGKSLTRICRALQGFEPETADGRALTMTPFVQRKPMSIRYRKGFAFFPLRFTTVVAVISDNQQGR